VWASDGDKMACLFGSCSLMSPKDFRFREGTAGGCRCILNISSVARWHCRILRPGTRGVALLEGLPHVSWLNYQALTTGQLHLKPVRGNVMVLHKLDQSVDVHMADFDHLCKDEPL
jgi:hypothetical protein